MKIRNSFVSNSSSSSFVMFTGVLEDEKVKKIKKWYNEQLEADIYIGDGGGGLDVSEFYVSGEIHGIYSEFMELINELGIEREMVYINEG